MPDSLKPNRRLRIRMSGGVRGRRLGAPSYSITFEADIKETINWYVNNTDWIENIVSGDYANYYEKMYAGVGEAVASK